MSLQATNPVPKVAPVYIVWNGEILIDAPIGEVWRHALNYPSWQNYSTVRRIAGEPGCEGEVMLLKKEEAGLNLPPYYARTIKLDPPRRVIWKTYRDTTDYFGIVEFRFQDVEGKTRFCNNLLYEHLIPYENESEVDDFRKRRYEMVELSAASILPKLKKIAEQRG